MPIIAKEIQCNLAKKAAEELDSYKKELIEEEIAGYSKQYKECRWYQDPTLKEILGDTRYADFIELKEALKEDCGRICELVDSLEASAQEMGRSWWDEDLQCERSGSEWETEFYTRLRNIAAKAAGRPEADWRDFYEGYGY